MDRATRGHWVHSPGSTSKDHDGRRVDRSPARRIEPDGLPSTGLNHVVGTGFDGVGLNARAGSAYRRRHALD